jgi:DNA-binding XRE family transcriptional regulator
VAKYDEWLTNEGLLRIGGWAKDGLTNEQIAHNMGISRQTLNEWSKKFPSISDTLKVNKDVVDRQVENALFNNAIEGNVTAQIFWLKNRKPDVWRDKRETKIEGNINDLSLNEAEELIKKYTGGEQG